MITYLDSEVGAIHKYDDRLSGNVLDLGGGMETFARATVVVDLRDNGVRARFVKGDLCDPNTYAQFGDKEFDWVWCNHTLEDLYNPFVVLFSCQRIAQRGMFGMPHWTREAEIQDIRSDWENISGWPHHFWMVGVNKQTNVLEFFPKQCWFVGGQYPCVTQNINFEWDGGDLPYRNIYHEYQGRSLRRELIAWLENRWLI